MMQRMVKQLDKRSYLEHIRKDWIEVELSKVCLKADKVKRKEVSGSTILKYLDIGGIDNISNRITGHKEFTWESAPSRAQQIVHKGDVLFSTVRTYLKNIALVKQDEYHNEICSSGFAVIRGNPLAVESGYLFYLSLSIGFLNTLNKLQSGTSYPAVRDKDVFSQTIPLPPLPEQRAIVSKIEALFSELDQGTADLKKAQGQLKVYRQAVLKKAFEGELTNTKMSVAIFKEFMSSKPQNGLYKPISEYGMGTRIIRIDGFYDGDIVEHYEYKRVKLGKEEIDKYSLNQGDILVNRVNSMSHLGKCGLVKNLDETTVFESNIMRIEVDMTKIKPLYLKHFLSSLKGIQELTKNAKQAVNQASINQKDVENTIVPFCDFSQQGNVVSEIESRLSLCDQVEQNITESLEKSKALRQSILKKAFEGALLSAEELEKCQNEEDWEPAGVLLERIKNANQ